MNKVAIIGLGLIGASLARALRENRSASHVTGFDANRAHADYALQHGMVDSAPSTLTECVQDAQMVVVATPLSVLEEVLGRIAPHMPAGCIVTDTLAVKEYAVSVAEKLLPSHAPFIPAHPIAGGEKIGPHASDALLFVGKKVIVCPGVNVSGEAVNAVEKLWRGVGGVVEPMPADTHDLVYAQLSHLPHLLAYASAATLDKTPGIVWDDAGLRNFLRIAGANPSMWADIFIANAAYLLPALDNFMAVLGHITGELLQGIAQGEASENSPATARLYARIVASSLIATTSDLEQKAGMKLAPYTGGGFTDFTAPALQAPDEEIKQISTHYRPVALMLADTMQALVQWRESIEGLNHAGLLAHLAPIQTAFTARYS